MNPAPSQRTHRLGRRWIALLCGLAAATGAHGAKIYEVFYTGTFAPAAGHVLMELEVRQSAGELRSLDLAAPEERYAEFAGPGKISRKGSRLIWRVPRTGGTLTYQAAVDSTRGDDSFDARMTPDWALLRLDDLVPSARVRARRGAEAQATLFLKGPDGWVVETRYGPMRHGPIRFDVPERRFDRPTGWAMAGKLGIRREEVAGRQVAIAAPSGSKYPRMPTLAFLRWTLPEVTRIFPQFPEHLLIVSAFDNMWRGALSGPSSLYLHGDRPMISEDGTSTLLHELVHVGTRMSSPTDDWIVEGLAEYYGLEVLRRSGGLAQERFEKTLTSLADWAEEADATLRHPSSGPHTARAVLLFHELQRELADADASLDEVVSLMLQQDRKVSRRALNKAARQVLGHSSAVLDAAPRTQSLR